MRLEPLLRLRVDHGADLHGRIARVAVRELPRRADDHREHAVGHVLLDAEQPQGRAALARGAEGGGHHVVGDLLGERGGVHDHGVDAAGLGDEGHDRPVLGGKRPG
jgi:hypothetical protein